jgi:UDP:flavonoid glycosyltransferase YjiC (YdhE family)
VQRVRSARRILFFPLSNVLGHLSRTLALAEELAAQGHEVHIALDGSYPALSAALPSSIRLHASPEMDAETTRSFGPIVCYDDHDAADRANLERAQRLDGAELRRRGVRLIEMVQRDSAIVAELRPDVVITDYRYTVERLRAARPRNIFHISHLLGYPSLYHRLRGARFAPLDTGRILVPGIEAIEGARPGGTAGGLDARVSWCGPFRWGGWARLSRARALPPPCDVLLCFGSTGRAESVVPELQQKLAGRWRVAAIPSEPSALEPYLSRSEVAFCHGGHGTVLECILHCMPMAIFPQNIEQLEIGHAIESLGLGILVKQPYAQLRADQLDALIERLKTDTTLQQNLRKYSALLRSQNGPARAAAIVLEQATAS